MTMPIPFVDLRSQYVSIQDEIASVIQGVLDSCTFVGGEPLASFEREFAAFCETEFAVCVAGGTDALHLTLRALGIGDGDEVITVANTFIATAAAIEMTGARPVFVDIDPRYYTLDPALLEPAITARTRAIIPVHLYGQPADMGPIMEIARRYHLAVIEDAAQAMARSARASVSGAPAMRAASASTPARTSAPTVTVAQARHPIPYSSAACSASAITDARRNMIMRLSATTAGWTP
jgi:dTDP-4-amino-4,6-dideoxygalactose transaminase